MAKPLSSDIVTLLQSDLGGLTPIQIYQLATQKLIEPNEAGDGLQVSSKATRAVKRAQKAAVAEEIRPKVWEAVNAVSQDPDKLFRLDDVLKASGLAKADHRQNILEALRHFRDGGMLESVKLSDNNFQIFWKRTPESLA